MQPAFASSLFGTTPTARKRLKEGWETSPPPTVILREAPRRNLMTHKRLAPTEGSCLQNC